MVVQDNNQIIKQSNEILDLLGDIQTFNLQSNVPRFIPSQYPDMNLKDGDMCFYKVDKSHSRNVPGTGLGLAIAKEIIRMHGAMVEVRSKLCSGTRFEISFINNTEKQENK